MYVVSGRLNGRAPLDDDDDDVDDDEQALKWTNERTSAGRSTSGRSSFPCRPRRQIPYLPNPINVGLIASNRLSGRPSVRPSRDLAVKAATRNEAGRGKKRERERERRGKMEQ